MSKDYLQGVPPLYPQHKEGEKITVTHLPMDIEQLKRRLLDYAPAYDDYTDECRQAVDALSKLQAENAELRRELEEARSQAFELSGVVVDTEQGHGFDDVCLATIKRVRDKLFTLGKAARQQQGDDAKG